MKNFWNCKIFSINNTFKFLGTALDKFSKIPPPVMCAIEFINSFLINGNRSFTYIFVGINNSSPTVLLESKVIWK